MIMASYGRVHDSATNENTAMITIGAILDDFLATLAPIYTGPCRIGWALIKKSPPIFLLERGYVLSEQDEALESKD